ncbi:histone-lysine N-methyltransferase SETMAR [Trichonephila clavipes]|nr:histone-lysine N-methyltransferase SETMAR [Trichonephila clavipes]
MLIKVSDAIRQKRIKEFRTRVVLHQDDVRPHASAMASWTLCTLEWDLMQHPLYSSYMTPSDYYLFFHLQLHLEGRIFHLNDKVINEVNRFLDSCTPHFLQKGFESCPKYLLIIVDLKRAHYFHWFC